MEGFDAKFEPPLDKRLECPICLLAQREPMQTPCGHRFCSACILRALRWANLKITCAYVIVRLRQREREREGEILQYTYTSKDYVFATYTLYDTERERVWSIHRERERKKCTYADYIVCVWKDYVTRRTNLSYKQICVPFVAIVYIHVLHGRAMVWLLDYCVYIYIYSS